MRNLFCLSFTIFFEITDLRSYCGYFLAICQPCLWVVNRSGAWLFSNWFSYFANFITISAIMIFEQTRILIWSFQKTLMKQYLSLFGYFLKEPLHWIDWTCLLVTTTGILLIARPKFLFGSQSESNQEYSDRWKGIVYALVSAMASSFFGVARRKIVDVDNLALLLLQVGRCGCRF